MSPEIEQSTHVWLAERMGDLSEDDLARAMKAAELTKADWAAMTEDCKGCDRTVECGAFLGLHARQDVRAAPDAHRNQGRFRLLRTALEKMAS